VNDPESIFTFTLLNESESRCCGDHSVDHLLEQFAHKDYVTLQRFHLENRKEEQIAFFCGCVCNMGTVLLTYIQ